MNGRVTIKVDPKFKKAIEDYQKAITDNLGIEISTFKTTRLLAPMIPKIPLPVEEKKHRKRKLKLKDDPLFGGVNL